MNPQQAGQEVSHGGAQPPNKGSSAMILGGVALVLLLAVGAGVMLLLRGGGGAGLAADSRWYADDTDGILVVDVAAARGSKIYGDLDKILSLTAEADRTFGKSFGLTVGDVSSVSVSFAFPENLKRQPKPPTLAVGVVHTSKAMTAEALKALQEKRKDALTEEKVEGKTLYVSGDTAHFLADANTLVIGDPLRLRAILGRNGPARLSAEMQAAIKEAGGSHTASLVVCLNSPRSPIRKMADDLPPQAAVAAKVDAVALHLDQGADFGVTLAAICSDEQTADGLKGMVDAGITMARAQMSQAETKAPKDMAGSMKQAAATLEQAKVNKSGRKVSVESVVKGDMLADMIKQTSKGPLKMVEF